MDRRKVHPLILLGLLINAISMGMLAYENYYEANIGYTVVFIILCLFLIALAGYGLVTNNRASKS